MIKRLSIVIGLIAVGVGAYYSRNKTFQEIALLIIALALYFSFAHYQRPKY